MPHFTVLETAPGQFERIDGNPVLDRLDGEARAPLALMRAESWTDADRAAYGIYLIAEAEVPDGHRVLSSIVSRIDGLVVEQLTTEPYNPVPAAVSPLQMRRALRAIGIKPQVDAFIAEYCDEETVEAWEYATEIQRANPLIAAAAVGLDLDEGEVDDLFRLAATL